MMRKAETWISLRAQQADTNVSPFFNELCSPDRNP